MDRLKTNKVNGTRGSIPIVSIVGLPNVGKSTLFNRLLGQRRAIVHETPGVTRDRNAIETAWRGIRFFLVDMGGIMPPDEGELDKVVARQVGLAVSESDLILFLVDAREPVAPADGDIAAMLRREGCPVILVANKVERAEDRSAYHALSEIGLGEPFPISAQQGINCGDLLDLIVERLPRREGAGSQWDEAVRVAVVGRPNAGKSSLINAVLGEERLVVHHEGGTTRDSIDTRIHFEGQPVILVDTAGLRRKSRVGKNVEYYANVRVVQSIERANVVVLLVDCTEGVVRQDLNILSLVEKRGRGIVLSFSKWDLTDTDPSAQLEAVDSLPPLISHIPIQFTSSLTGEGLAALLRKVLEVGRKWNGRVGTPRLNNLLREAVGRRSPPSFASKPVRLFYISQVKTSPPEYVVVTSSPKGIRDGYRRYLTNFFRKRLDLEGIPIRMRFRQRKHERRSGDLKV